MTSVSGAKCEIIIPSRCFPFDYRERNIAEFFVCHSRPERCLPTCKGKTLFSRDPSCAHNAERRFCSLEKIGRLQVRCSHTHQIKIVTPSALGCEDCLRIGSPWVHLRLCRSCGHVGCCDQSPHRHARGHFEASGHPIIEGYDPPEGWGWCYVDDIEVDLPSQTPHNGPIPRFV